MKLTIREMTNTHGTILVEGVHPYFVNAMRRVLLAEVPKLAIDQVTFYDNTSALFDEIIAHRLALLPVPTDPSTLNRLGEVDDEGNPGYLVRYTLTKEGPCTVYSGDLEPEDKEFAIVDPKIPVVELLAGQRLILEAMAVLGQGTTHAKWQVCSAVGYKYYPTGKVDNRKVSEEQAKMAVANAPNVLALDGGKLVITDEENVDLADGVLPGGLTVDYDDRKFLFTFETDGALKAEDALLKAVQLLKERFEGFQAALADL